MVKIMLLQDKSTEFILHEEARYIVEIIQ